MDCEKVAALNGATTAYAAALQAWIAAEEFAHEMYQTEPDSLPGGTETIDFAERSAITARVTLEWAHRRLERISHLVGP